MDNEQTIRFLIWTKREFLTECTYVIEFTTSISTEVAWQEEGEVVGWRSVRALVRDQQGFILLTVRSIRGQLPKSYVDVNIFGGSKLMNTFTDV